MAKHNHGEVTATLQGREYVMQPTPAAMKAIDRRFGSTADALEALRRPSLETVTFIIFHGAQVSKGDYEQLENDVFNHGLMNTTGLVGEYLIALLNPTGEDQEPGEGKA